MPDHDEATVPPWRRRLPYVAAAVVFVAASWYAVSGVEVPDDGIRWGAVAALVLVGVPVLAVLNGEEFRAMAALLGLRRPFAEGLRVSVLGSAANVLPVPGAALVRLTVLRRAGAGYGQVSTALLLTAACWAGATAVVAGGLLSASGRTALGPLALVAGVVAWVVVGLVARWRLPSVTPRAFARLVVVEVASVVVGAVRFLLVIVAVGEPVDLGQAAALTVAGVVAAATGIFPGGLGLREALAGIIGPMVQLPSQLAVLAAVGNRLAEYVVLAPAALLLSRTDPSVATIREQADEEVREQAGDDDLE